MGTQYTCFLVFLTLGIVHSLLHACIDRGHCTAYNLSYYSDWIGIY